MVLGIYKISIKSIEGNSLELSQYVGKVLLIINVASKCGFTSQYKEIQELHKKYESKGLCIMAFPCNDFANQEPESINEIRDFCDHKYGVMFGVFEKITIRGGNPHSLYKYLEALFSPVVRPKGIKAKFFRVFTSLMFWVKEGRFPRAGEVQWNFHKFIIDRKGTLVGHFSSDCSPFGPQVLKCIEHELGMSSVE